MIAFDLRCGADHVFEGWFRSSADYEDQRARSLIPCPICGATEVTKAVMAPNVAAKGNQRQSLPVPRQPVPAEGVGSSAAAPIATNTPNLPPEMAALLGKIAEAQAAALPQSRWVGDRFAKEARAAHAVAEDTGEVAAAIHGQATAAEAEALIEEGIGVMPLLVPFVPPEAKN